MQPAWASKNHTEEIKCLLTWLTDDEMWGQAGGGVSLGLEHSSTVASEGWLEAAAPYHFPQGGDLI